MAGVVKMPAGLNESRGQGAGSTDVETPGMAS